MSVGPECLSADEAVELGELLEFLGGWLVGDAELLRGSLASFVGCPAYRLDDLRGDLTRFAVLLGGGQNAFTFAGLDR